MALHQLSVISAWMRWKIPLYWQLKVITGTSNGPRTCCSVKGNFNKFQPNTYSAVRANFEFEVERCTFAPPFYERLVERNAKQASSLTEFT